MVIPKFVGTPLAGVYPFKVDFTNYSVNADSYLWDFGDGNTSTEESPSHYYIASGQFNVTLTATNTATSESDSLTKASYVSSFDNKFSLNEYYAGTSAVAVPYKTCTEFVTLGWIKSPVYKNGDYVIPLAVGDSAGNVLASDESLKFMLLREAGDYKFVFNNSQSQLVNKSIGIDLEDGQWHFLRWACTGNGIMRYSVDSTLVPFREGSNSNGLEYSIAYNRAERIGGGDVWCPYVYAAGQSITLYNWRFGLGFALTDSWVKDLMDIDREYLGT